MFWVRTIVLIVWTQFRKHTCYASTPILREHIQKKTLTRVKIH